MLQRCVLIGAHLRRGRSLLARSHLRRRNLDFLDRRVQRSHQAHSHRLVTVSLSSHDPPLFLASCQRLVQRHARLRRPGPVSLSPRSHFALKDLHAPLDDSSSLACTRQLLHSRGAQRHLPLGSSRPLLRGGSCPLQRTAPRVGTGARLRDGIEARIQLTLSCILLRHCRRQLLTCCLKGVVSVWPQRCLRLCDLLSQRRHLCLLLRTRGVPASLRVETV